jgi:hypothetical protein
MKKLLFFFPLLIATLLLSSCSKQDMGQCRVIGKTGDDGQQKSVTVITPGLDTLGSIKMNDSEFYSTKVGDSIKVVVLDGSIYWSSKSSPR